MHPLLILLVGVAVILIAILGLRLNAFLALTAAALVVALLAPGEPATKLVIVSEGFGGTAGRLGVIVALAAIIGHAMSASGASDRIVQGFLDLLGEKRASVALASTAWVLSLPVFFDTIFFLLAPLARAMHRRTGKDYLKYLLAVSAGAVATHALVPPHPGPLAMGDALGVDLGLMVLMGMVVSLPSAAAGLLYARWAGNRWSLEPLPVAPEPQTTERGWTPSLVPALVPVLLPVTLISSNTIVSALLANDPAHAGLWRALTPWTAILGNANMALFLSACVALLLYWRALKPGRQGLSAMVESSLMGAGVIVLIVGAGGAFGAALQAARIGMVVQNALGGNIHGTGVLLLVAAFVIAALLRSIQGSATVSMVTTSGMLAASLQGVQLPFNPVYIATAIGGGSLLNSWMNDAGFWVFSRVGGVSERDTLRSWMPMSDVVGTTALLVTVVLALALPLR